MTTYSTFCMNKFNCKTKKHTQSLFSQHQIHFHPKWETTFSLVYVLGSGSSRFVVHFRIISCKPGKKTVLLYTVKEIAVWWCFFYFLYILSLQFHLSAHLLCVSCSETKGRYLMDKLGWVVSWWTCICDIYNRKVALTLVFGVARHTVHHLMSPTLLCGIAYSPITTMPCNCELN